MIKSARLETHESGYRLYDFHYAGEIYPIIELTAQGFVVYADYGMDIRQIHKSFSAFVAPKDIYIYMPDKGLYYDNLRKVKRKVLESDCRKNLPEQKRRGFETEQLELLLAKLQEADRKSRGYEIDKDGRIIKQLRGKACAVSPLDESRFLYLTLFGGFLGLHRFYAKKLPSGCFYLLSCGGFIIGWFLDIMLFYSSRFKDGSGQYILPDERSYQKLFLLFFVTFIACFAMASYLVLLLRLCALII